MNYAMNFSRPVLALLLILGACASNPRRELARHDEDAYRSPSAGAAPSRFAFEWPLEKPKVINFFGWRKRRMHDGIDLKAARGTPVYAAGPGQVIYTGRKIRGYGKMIVIDHGGGWSSVYAHLSEIIVQTGEKVGAESQIALSGNTGRSSGPHLHFEIRNGSDPLDPLLLLPNGLKTLHVSSGETSSARP